MGHGAIPWVHLGNTRLQDGQQLELYTWVRRQWLKLNETSIMTTGLLEQQLGRRKHSWFFAGSLLCSDIFVVSTCVLKAGALSLFSWGGGVDQWLKTVQYSRAQTTLQKQSLCFSPCNYSGCVSRLHFAQWRKSSCNCLRDICSGVL